jgi:glycerol-1-phosphate dehydrogenase [NAD(P)+]
VGAPTEPGEIGLTRERLRATFHRAYFIRRRFTVLDLVVRTGTLETCLDTLFGAKGPWAKIN